MHLHSRQAEAYSKGVFPKAEPGFWNEDQNDKAYVHSQKKVGTLYSFVAQKYCVVWSYLDTYRQAIRAHMSAANPNKIAI